jgi:transposase InsO family protein
MHAALRAEGHRVSRGRVERLMRRHGIRALARRRFRPTTTDSRHALPIAPNLLQQEFAVSEPNRVWLTDITYIPTGEAGFTWRRCWILRPGRWWAGRCAITCAPSWPLAP